MTANNKESFLAYLNNLVDEYNNSYNHFICKNTTNTDCSVLTEKIKTNPKSSKFEVAVRVRFNKYKNIFSKGYTENWSKEIFVIDSVLKTNPQTYKFKDLNGEKIIGSSYEKREFLSRIR